jgi:hypothetical protein
LNNASSVAVLPQVLQNFALLLGTEITDLSDVKIFFICLLYHLTKDPMKLITSDAAIMTVAEAMVLVLVSV